MIATGNTLYVCPRCGKPALSIHKKTYERSVIVFCTNCRLNSAFVPSKDAYDDTNLVLKEFIFQYRENNPQGNLLTT